MKSRMLNRKRVAAAAIIALFGLAAPAFAWMGNWSGNGMGYGGGMGNGMMRGGMCRMMDVTPQPVDPATLPEPDSQGAQILQSKCTQCHGLLSPRQHASQEWPYIVDRMDRRMRMMSGGGMGMMMRSDIQPLAGKEKGILLTYLQQNAFKAMEASDLPDSSEPGAQTFTRICSQCHALPDPSAYTADQWRSIVERMGGNMKNMGFGSLEPAQKKAILGYLEKRNRNR